MKKALVMLSSCFLVLLLAASASAQSAQGFSVLLSDQTLWTFGDPSSLDMFLHQVVSLSLGSGAPVSAAAGDNGGFVVAATNGLAAREDKGWNSFGLTGHRLSDVAFVPHSANNTVVAFGVANGIVYNNPYFMRSLDGGKTWDEGITVGQTEATGSGSIAFSGNLGFAAIGGLIFRSTDGGASWTSSYSGFTTITKVAVFDSSLIVATGPGTVSRVSLISVNGGSSWETFQLPTFNPTAASVTGVAFLDATKWVVTTSGGEIWRTDGQVWNRTFAATNISWVDVAFLPHWASGGILLAAGSVPLSTNTGIFALSWDQGLTWTLSAPQSNAAFVRVVAGLPLAPAPSPSASASPSVSPSPSVSSSPSPSGTPTRSPSASATPSVGSTPSSSPSVSPTASVTPSVSPTPSPTASPSVSASVSVTPSSSPSASVTPSRSPSASVTPSISPSASVSPSKGSSPSPSRTPSVTPSKGSSPSPSPTPAKKKDDGINKKLALGLGLGLGLGGLVALIGGAALFWYLKQKGARRNVYQAINTNDV